MLSIAASSDTMMGVPPSTDTHPLVRAQRVVGTEELLARNKVLSFGVDTSVVVDVATIPKSSQQCQNCQHLSSQRLRPSASVRWVCLLLPAVLGLVLVRETRVERGGLEGEGLLFACVGHFDDRSVIGRCGGDEVATEVIVGDGDQTKFWKSAR